MSDSDVIARESKHRGSSRKKSSKSKSSSSSSSSSSSKKKSSSTRKRASDEESDDDERHRSRRHAEMSLSSATSSATMLLPRGGDLPPSSQSLSKDEPKLFSLEAVAHFERLREYCSQRILRLGSNMVELISHWLSTIRRFQQQHDESHIAQLERIFSIVVGASFCKVVESECKTSNNNNNVIRIHVDIVKQLEVSPDLVNLLDYYATSQATLLGISNTLMLCLVDPLQYYQEVLLKIIHLLKFYKIHEICDKNYALALGLADRAISEKLAILVSFPIEPLYLNALYAEEAKKRELYVIKLPVLSACFQHTQKIRSHLARIAELGQQNQKINHPPVVETSLLEKLTTISYQQLQTSQTLLTVLRSVAEKIGPEMVEHLKQLRQTTTTTSNHLTLLAKAIATTNLASHPSHAPNVAAHTPNVAAHTPNAPSQTPTPLHKSAGAGTSLATSMISSSSSSSSASSSSALSSLTPPTTSTMDHKHTITDVASGKNDHKATPVGVGSGGITTSTSAAGSIPTAGVSGLTPQHFSGDQYIRTLMQQIISNPAQPPPPSSIAKK
jgi:hypothetical protein